MYMAIKNIESSRYKTRVCLFSQRGFRRELSRCATYEFEDTIMKVDDAELIYPAARRNFELTRRVANQAALRTKIACLNPGIQSVRLKRDYDIFVFLCQFPSDLISLNAVKGRKDHCRISVCYLEELWAAELKKWRAHLKLLSDFDYVFLNCKDSVELLQSAINTQCRYLPPAVDIIKFCPFPDPPVRFIDVYNMGRRSSITHRCMLEMARKNNFFYIYDTILPRGAANVNEHRSLVANIAKRSRDFFANCAKIDLPIETHGQSEIGFRFFEGAAAGAVMLGDYSSSEAFRENFNWPDAVIPVPFNSPNIAEILTQLDFQTDRLRAIRKNNIVQSLLRHDWLHRWQKILDVTGLKGTDKLIKREHKLKKLAHLAIAWSQDDSPTKCPIEQSKQTFTSKPLQKNKKPVSRTTSKKK
ncbi:MAG: glycosyltransferase family 1 protein [Planctomycetes bacterium]|nr:glycosyltransferase family 1 protein [Planctomycetota bacterium]